MVTVNNFLKERKRRTEEVGWEGEGPYPDLRQGVKPSGVGKPTAGRFPGKGRERGEKEAMLTVMSFPEERKRRTEGVRTG